MSLACLACHVLESSPERTLRSYSDNGGRCLGLGCWTRKMPQNAAQIEPVVSSASSSIEDSSARTRQQQVAPAPAAAAAVVDLGAARAEEQVPGSPRLTRCHAVRRDLFRDWNFEEMSRQLCINLSGAA